MILLKLFVFTFSYKPETVKVYLHSLSTFLKFLAGSSRWLKEVGLATSVVEMVGAKVRLIAKSLDKDVHKAAVERLVYLLLHLDTSTTSMKCVSPLFLHQ